MIFPPHRNNISQIWAKILDDYIILALQATEGNVY